MSLTDRIRALPSALLPRSLRHQLLLLMLVVSAAAMGLLDRVSGSRFDAAALASCEDTARSLVGAAAATAEPALQTGDVALAEPALRALASLPGVKRLVVLDAQGAPLLALHQAADGSVSSAPAAAADAAAWARAQPAGMAPDGEGLVQAWAAAGPGGLLGRVGIVVALAQWRGHVAALRHDTAAAVGLAALALLIAAYLYMARALAPLQRQVRFAGELASRMDVLSTEQARTLSIINALPDVILDLDGDCRIGSANPGVASVFGLPPDEMRDLPLQDFLPGITREEAEARTTQGLFMRATRTHVARFEITARRHDGTDFPAEVSLSRIETDEGARFAAVVRDVTERERARMAIAERSARLNTVFDLSPDGFVVFDVAGALAYSNRAFQAMTGWGATAAGMTLQDFDERFAALCEQGQAYEPVQALLGEPGGTDSAHTLLLALPERRVLARVVRSPVEGQSESILFFRDVTRETEVDRMKSEFLSTAAHELRTPMVSVFGFTELLLRKPVPEARRRDMLETIHRQASLLINMVNELLDLARIEARQGKDLKREACRIDSLVTQAVGPLVGNSALHEIVLDVPDGDRILWVDPEKTHRALTNVLSNALKYSPEGGTVRVSTQRGRLQLQDAVGLTVTDSGIGMSPEQLSRVFERFYRADPSGNIPGTGLGMSLVKEIVELQGGRVDIASLPDHGTTVTLWLPLCEQPALPAEAGC